MVKKNVSTEKSSAAKKSPSQKNVTEKAVNFRRDNTPSGGEFEQWWINYKDFYPLGSRLDVEFRMSRLLVLASRSWVNRIDNILRKETGQTRARWQAMFALSFAEQPATMSDLAKRLRVQWPTLVRVIDGMVEEGLVHRRDNPQDGRSKLVHLTSKGDKVMAKIQPILDKERAAMLAELSEEELRVCSSVLQKIFDRLKDDS